MSTPEAFCVNHPNTATLLRCNRCGNPVCLRCVQRTPVGFRCKSCLHVQQSGFYTAGPFDYVLTFLVGSAVAAVTGGLMAAIGGFWLLAIFAGPIGGGAIAEGIRFATQRRRGRYLWLVACLTVIAGGVLGAAFLPLLLSLGAAGGRGLPVRAALAPLAAIFNIGFLIYLGLAVSTVYARLRA